MDNLSLKVLLSVTRQAQYPAMQFAWKRIKKPIKEGDCGHLDGQMEKT
jgi:hypothetical protein